jgi:hypothetical protein
MAVALIDGNQAAGGDRLPGPQIANARNALPSVRSMASADSTGAHRGAIPEANTSRLIEAVATQNGAAVRTGISMLEPSGANVVRNEKTLGREAAPFIGIDSNAIASSAELSCRANRW